MSLLAWPANRLQRTCSPGRGVIELILGDGSIGLAVPQQRHRLFFRIHQLYAKALGTQKRGVWSARIPPSNEEVPSIRRPQLSCGKVFSGPWQHLPQVPPALLAAFGTVGLGYAIRRSVQYILVQCPP